ncbi:MAG: addiction module protein [Gammaproteobacteria bacterium]|nr:addiction module protein [Gammaproteobacteria bacterium]
MTRFWRRDGLRPGQTARSLNPTESEIDWEWGREARRRLAELRSGSVAAVPGQRVFEAIRDKFVE